MIEVREASSGTIHVGSGEGRAVRMPGLQVLTRKVGSEQTGGAYSLFEVAVGPGGCELLHIQHREDECFYVLEGKFEFLIEGARIEVGTGSLIYVPKGNLHAVKSAGNTTGRLLVSQTPGGGYQSFVEEAGEPATDVDASPTAEEPTEVVERLAAIGAEYGLEMVSPPP
jgi:mannose-6-phosphate isomerase-like protein (cupin superfamily)